MSNNIFIFSFSRSGSTLLCNLLNNNKNINLINESWFHTNSINIGMEKYKL